LEEKRFRFASTSKHLIPDWWGDGGSRLAEIEGEERPRGAHTYLGMMKEERALLAEGL